MTYRTTKCPHCGYTLENMVLNTTEMIGPPTATCPSCYNTFSTGMNYWEDMTVFEKTKYLLWLLISLPFTAGLMTGVWLLFSYFILSLFTDAGSFIDNQNSLVTGYIMVSAIVAFIILLYGVSLQIKEK